MQKIFIIASFLFLKPALSQKLYGIVNLTTPFSGISHVVPYDKLEFRPTVARINFSWRFDFVYKPEASEISHNVHFEEIPFGIHFKIINKFLSSGDTLYGHKYASFGYFIDYYSLGYSLIKEGKKDKRFLLNSKIRFNYSAGLAATLNRSKDYYNQVLTVSSDGTSNPWTYIEHVTNHYRKGVGLFFTIEGGFWFINQAKNKKILKLNMFYQQGLKDMMSNNVHYRYGYFNDPSKRVEVTDQKVYTRGTTFGFSLGLPINILK